jgi:ketosteroid isomerase-like protein
MAGNADVLRELVEAFNRRDYERAAGLVTDSCEFLDVAAGETYHGPEGIVEAFRTWESAFPDMVIRTLSIVETERGAAGEFVGRGTHDGPLPSPEGEIGPTGKKVDERFSIIAEVEAGKITGFREYYDAMTMMAQLGLIPEGAEAP